MTPTLEELQAVADKLSVDYSAEGAGADTTETLTTKILAVTPTLAQLKSMSVDELKVLADVWEMTYTYTNKQNLIADILEKISESET